MTIRDAKRLAEGRPADILDAILSARQNLEQATANVRYQSTFLKSLTLRELIELLDDLFAQCRADHAETLRNLESAAQCAVEYKRALDSDELLKFRSKW